MSALDNTSRAGGLRSWLTADSPGSAWQAKCGRWYLSWRALRRNPLAFIGLLIIITLLLTAIFAPWIATSSGIEQDLSHRRG